MIRYLDDSRFLAPEFGRPNEFTLNERTCIFVTKRGNTRSVKFRRTRYVAKAGYPARQPCWHARPTRKIHGAIAEIDVAGPAQNSLGPLWVVDDSPFRIGPSAILSALAIRRTLSTNLSPFDRISASSREVLTCPSDREHPCSLVPSIAGKSQGWRKPDLLAFCAINHPIAVAIDAVNRVARETSLSSAMGVSWRRSSTSWVPKYLKAASAIF